MAQPKVTVNFTAGVLSVALLPTDAGSPVGRYYSVTCISPLQTVNGRRVQPYTWPTKLWLVPTSATPLDISLVETTAAPSTILSAIGTTSVDSVDGITTPAIRLNPASLAKPTCAVGQRGKFWVTSSAGGTQDLVEICTKQADDTYTWASSVLESTSTAALGDLPYRTATGWIRLAGNILSSKRLLCQTGTGSVSAAPSWCALVAGDIPDISATYSTKTAGGDLSGTLPSPSVAKVNGTSVPVNSAADQLLGTTASATGSWITVGNCVAAGGVLQYATASHTFSCHTLVASDIPDVSATYSTKTAGGDLSGTLPSPTVAKINGTSVPTNAAADQVLGTTASATAAWVSVGNCVAAGGVLQYATASHTFSCHALVSADIPNNAANTTGNALTATTATSATTATNLAAGTTGQFPYQTGAGATGFRTPNAANGPVVLDASGSGAINTTLPAGAPAGSLGVGGCVYNPGVWADIRCWGAKVDNATDDTTAVNAAITAAYNAGGGTIFFPVGKTLIAGAIVLPNNGIAVNGSIPFSRQPNFRFTGVGDVRNGQGQAPGTGFGGSVLRMTYSGATGKIVTLGLGLLEIDHLTIWDDSGASTPFLLTTGTTLNIHDMAVLGSKTGTAADQDSFILGGTCPGCTGSTDSEALNSTDAPFQGYDTHINNVFFNKIRRAVYGRTWVAATHVDGNMIGPQSGSNQTASISAATNANPVSLTSTSHGFPTGVLAKTIPVVISGATGGWTGINGTFNATITGVNTFTIPVDSTAFGALAGAPVYPIGAPFEFDGHWVGNNTVENQVVNNRCEITGYAYCAKFISSQNNYLAGMDVEDAQAALNTAVYWFDATSSGNIAIINSAPNGGSITVANHSIDANGANTIIDSSSSSTNYLTNGTSGNTIVNAITTRAASIFGLPIANVATSGGNFGASTVTIQRGSVWNGSAAINDDWAFTNAVGSGSNPTSQLTLTHTGSSGAPTLLFPTQVKFGGSQQSNFDSSGGLNMTATASITGNIFVNNNDAWTRTTTAATSGANRNSRGFRRSYGGSDRIA